MSFGSSESRTKTRLPSTILSNAGGAGTGEGGRSGLFESGGGGGGVEGKSLDVIPKSLLGSWWFDAFLLTWSSFMGVSSTCMSSLNSELSILSYWFSLWLKYALKSSDVLSNTNKSARKITTNVLVVKSLVPFFVYYSSNGYNVSLGQSKASCMITLSGNYKSIWGWMSRSDSPAPAWFHPNPTVR